SRTAVTSLPAHAFFALLVSAEGVLNHLHYANRFAASGMSVVPTLARSCAMRGLAVSARPRCSGTADVCGQSVKSFALKLMMCFAIKSAEQRRLAGTTSAKRCAARGSMTATTRRTSACKFVGDHCPAGTTPARISVILATVLRAELCFTKPSFAPAARTASSRQWPAALHFSVFCGVAGWEVCGTEPPQCDEPCAQPMECGHTCPAKCHQGDHPLCYEPVDRPCIGGHTQMKNVPCHVGPMSCGQACGKQLPCGHSCSSQCHSGDCKACTKPCGARRVHCSHNCQAPCHAGSQCEDAPCRCKVKQACPCGQRVEERSCGAFSGLPRPQFAAPRCLASCERPSLQLPEGEVVKYTADLLQLAMHNRRYVQMLEDTFAALMSKGRAEAPGRTPQVPSMQALPPCDASRRLLAIEYARLHWRFKTATKSDVAEGWWQVQVAPASSSRVPRPLLSEIAGASSMSAVSSHLLPALSSQPCLRFAGLKSVDEVYDLVGLEGLLGVRPGDAGEAIAFLERGALGAAIFKKLTSQEPGQEFISVRGQSAWGQPGASASRPRVKLEQTLTSGPRAPRPKPQLDAWESKEEAVPENWEDM
ncbi:unnamed protein product, partial [Effrenium voratum]